MPPSYSFFDTVLPMGSTLKLKIVRDIGLAFVGTLILWASAKIQVPFWPVPMTMQTYVVLVIGALYGWGLGSITMVLYLIEGALGLPVFAGGGGLTYIVEKTGGYLLGFIAATMIIGLLTQGKRNFWNLTVAMILGNIVIYVFGVTHLALQLMNFEEAIYTGLIRFILADTLKTVLAVTTVTLAWRLR